MTEMSDHQPLDEQALCARERFRARLHGAELQPLFDYLPDVYFVAKDMQGRVMLANQLAARM